MEELEAQRIRCHRLSVHTSQNHNFTRVDIIKNDRALLYPIEMLNTVSNGTALSDFMPILKKGFIVTHLRI